MSTRIRRLLPSALAIVLLVTILAFLRRPQSQTNVFGDAAHRFNNHAIPVCRWHFDDYESSAYEKAWLQLTASGGVNDNVCSVVAEEPHRTVIHRLMGRIASLINLEHNVTWTRQDTARPMPAQPYDELLSRFHYRRECFSTADNAWQPASGRGVQLIEPLFGMLRDPFDVWCENFQPGTGLNSLPPGYSNAFREQSKSHIVPQGFAPYAYTLEDAEPDRWRQHGLPPWFTSPRRETHGGIVTFRSPQMVHLDLGASYFSVWDDNGSFHNHTGSGEWFYNTYHKRGLPFDRFVAVELQPLDRQKVFDQVPEDLMGKYTMMNIGLSMDKDKYNTMNLIRRIVQKEDFFVFKVDIDSAPVELPIMEALLADDFDTGVSQLIDELYFEHHVKYLPMSRMWSLQDKDAAVVGNLTSSYKLFRDLRERGIRAHSWP